MTTTLPDLILSLRDGESVSFENDPLSIRVRIRCGGKEACWHVPRFMRFANWELAAGAMRWLEHMRNDPQAAASATPQPVAEAHEAPNSDYDSGTANNEARNT